MELTDGKQAVGAKLYLKLPGDARRLHEITAGSGYLSQSSMHLPGDVEIDRIDWPTPSPATAK